MKRIVEEISVGGTSEYRVTEYDSVGKRTHMFTSNYLIKRVSFNDKLYFVIYDSKGNKPECSFKFLNDYLETNSINTRYFATMSIKTLSVFSDIVSKSIRDLNYDDFKLYIDFLKGETKNFNYEFYLANNRSYKSVLAIISANSKFLTVNGFGNNKLLNRAANYLNSYKIDKSNYECPKFISARECMSIIGFIDADTRLDQETKLKYKTMIKLMFNAGLRIGEVLGLTLEDFERIILEDGTVAYRVYIRNRLSDSKNQLAKTCIKVTSKADYKRREYKVFRKSYQIVNISESLYAEIMDYFDLMSARFAKEGKIPALADSIVDDTVINYYIYNNIKNNTPLRNNTFYDYLRFAFVKCGIPVDSEKKENNLCHRFRHGFIMRLLYVENMDPFEVIAYSRHSSVRSLEAYNNPTPEMIIRVYEGIEEGF